MKTKTNWHDVIDVHLWAAKIWLGIDPKLFISTALLEIVNVLTPYITLALRRFESTKPLEGNGYLVMGTEEGFLQKSHISSSLSVPVHPGWE